MSSIMTVLLVMLGLTLVYTLFMVIHSSPEPGTLISGYLGLVLMASAFVALGLFISSLTENQLIAAVATFGVLLIFWVIQWLTPSEILSYVSINKHIENFIKGMIDTRDVVYYLIFAVLWIFMTLRVLESKKWRG